MSAETKATRAVVYAIGVPVPEPDVNTREHDRGEAEPERERYSPGVRGEKGCGRCVRRTSLKATASSEAQKSEA